MKSIVRKMCLRRKIRRHAIRARSLAGAAVADRVNATVLWGWHFAESNTEMGLSMSRNIVICCDGTNNQFGPENTNVVRLVQGLERDPTKQLLYYDPGVGTLPEPGVFTWLGKKLSTWFDLAFGTGLSRKVEGAYTYLMDFIEPGDQVFLFGFSRGAYTVRVLAGLLHSLGLLPRGSHNLVPYAMRLFAAIRGEGAARGIEGTSEYWKLCQEFRWTFARPVPGDDQRRFRVHFLGVWDTVSSVGWVWDPTKFPFTAHNPSIDVIRHAVSVDERRWFFRQNLMEQTGEQNLQELWFPGVHADIGGGYPEADSGLWRMPFEWILAEAEKSGLALNPQRLQKIMEKTTASLTPWRDKQHESLRGAWRLAEFFPKWQWQRSISSWKRVLRIGRCRYRRIAQEALLHKSTLLRIRETSYSPPNLSLPFIEKVRALAVVPEHMPFIW
jgi:uncharacterized protein (DUF2235 family)